MEREPSRGVASEDIYDTNDFRIYEYKVKRCSRSRPHDWTQCPFSHSGEKAKRRDPRRFAYTGAACPDYRKNASCRRGDKCPFAHGVFESWLHPSRYRTQCCTDGVACKRRVCFFAHQDSELRKPEDDPALLQAQLQAEALASTETYQQILASASLDTVPEALPTSSATSQLNLAILQSLLQNNGAAQRLPSSWAVDSDTQDHGRMYQLQALLAALQLRAPALLPPQPSQNDALSSLDTMELGRLLAANQALVQQQAEREMLQRSSFEAARRNSMSSDVGMVGGSELGRQNSYLGGCMQNSGDQGYGDGGGNARNNFSPGVRRMSMDNAGSQMISSQGLDPRILAALAAAQRVNAPGGQPQGRNAAAVRRSVDMGMLAHAAAMGGAGRHGGNSSGFPKQFGEQTSIPEDTPGMESSGQPQQEASAFANAFNLGGGPMDARQFGSQGSGFLAPAGQEGMEQLIGLASADQAALNAGLLQNHEGQGFQRTPSNFGNNQINGQSQEVRRYLEQMGGPPSGHLSRQASEQLSAQSSSVHFTQGLTGQGSAAHLGSFGQILSSGSSQLSSLGQMSRQASSGYGQPLQTQTSGHIGSLQGHLGQPRYSPGRRSFSSADSLGRLSDAQQHQQQLAHFEDAMNGGWTSPLESNIQQGPVYQGNGGAAERGAQGCGSAASLQLLQPEENARAGDGASGSSTPSRGPPTPGVQVTAPQHCMVSPRHQPPSMHSSSPASHTTTYETSPRSMSLALSGQPPIPEEAPGWQQQAMQPPSAAAAAEAAYHARRMPTLLEQLQLFERQRQGSFPSLHAQAMARNTSFESLSAELPRSISDLNLAEHNLNSSRMAPSIPASSN